MVIKDTVNTKQCNLPLVPEPNVQNILTTNLLVDNSIINEKKEPNEIYCQSKSKCTPKTKENINETLGAILNNDIEHRGEKSAELLLKAVETGCVALVNSLMLLNVVVDYVGSKQRHTAFVESVIRGYHGISSILLNKGANVNAVTTKKRTALHIAAKNDDLKMIHLLISHEIKLDLTDDDGHTAVMEATLNNNYDIVDALIKAGCKVASTGDFKETPLSLAAYKGNLKMVEYLLPIIKMNDHWCQELYSALMEASMDGHIEVAKYLLSQGAPTNMNIEGFESPLMLAACSGNSNYVSLLLDHGSFIDETNEDGNTPLMEACREGHEYVVSLLLGRGADTNIKSNETRETALSLAAAAGYIDIVKLLIAVGADIEGCYFGDTTPLIEACKIGHYNISEFLLEKGANVCAQTKDFQTPLILAVASGSVELVKLLLKYGGDPAEFDALNMNSLIHASNYGYLDIVKILVERGCDINCSEGDCEMTPLIGAVMNGHLEVVKYLVENGSEIKPIMFDSGTLLIEAVKIKNAAIVKYLLGMDDDASEINSNECEPISHTKSNEKHKCNRNASHFHKSCCHTSPESKSVLNREDVVNLMEADKMITTEQRALLISDTDKLDAFIKRMMLSIENSTDLSERQKVRQKIVLDEIRRVKLSNMLSSYLNSPTLLQMSELSNSELENGANQLSLIPHDISNAEISKILEELVNSDFISSCMSDLDYEVETEVNGIDLSLENQSHKEQMEIFEFQRQRLNYIKTEINLYQAEFDKLEIRKEIVENNMNALISKHNYHKEELEKLHSQQLQIHHRHHRHKIIKAEELKLASEIMNNQEKLNKMQRVWVKQLELVKEIQTINAKKHRELLDQEADMLVKLAQEQPMIQSDHLVESIMKSKEFSSAVEQQMRSRNLTSNNEPSQYCCLYDKHEDHVCYELQNQHQHKSCDNYLAEDRKSHRVPIVDINAMTNSKNETALTLAATNGNVELVKLLIEAGADVNHRDKKGFTPLILATAASAMEVVKILLCAGADIQASSDKTRDTALSLSCSTTKNEVNRYVLVTLLLDHGADIEHRNVSDYTPLSLASSGGYIDIIKLLLEHGAEINARTGSKLGISPLMLASMNGHKDAVDYLLSKGADIHAQIETNRNTALTLASFQGREEVVRLLLKHGPLLEHRSKTGLTPLMEAASGGYVSVGTLLIENHADVDAGCGPPVRDTPLSIAAEKGHVKFVELLIGSGASLNVKNKKGNSPLYQACAGGYHEIVKRLITARADPDSHDSKKVTCITVAFRKGYINIVRSLVKCVKEFPNDEDCDRFITTLKDYDLEQYRRCITCLDILRNAKNQQECQANRNASQFLMEEENAKLLNDKKNATMARKREKRKKQKNKAKETKSVISNVESTGTYIASVNGDETILDNENEEFYDKDMTNFLLNVKEMSKSDENFVQSNLHLNNVLSDNNSIDDLIIFKPVSLSEDLDINMKNDYRVPSLSGSSILDSIPDVSEKKNVKVVPKGKKLKKRNKTGTIKNKQLIKPSNPKSVFVHPPIPAKRSQANKNEIKKSVENIATIENKMIELQELLDGNNINFESKTISNRNESPKRNQEVDSTRESPSISTKYVTPQNSKKIIITPSNTLSVINSNIDYINLNKSQNVQDKPNTLTSPVNQSVLNTFTVNNNVSKIPDNILHNYTNDQSNYAGINTESNKNMQVGNYINKNIYSATVVNSIYNHNWGNGPIVNDSLSDHNKSSDSDTTLNADDKPISDRYSSSQTKSIPSKFEMQSENIDSFISKSENLNTMKISDLPQSDINYNYRINEDNKFIYDYAQKNGNMLIPTNDTFIETQLISQHSPHHFNCDNTQIDIDNQIKTIDMESMFEKKISVNQRSGIIQMNRKSARTTDGWKEVRPANRPGATISKKVVVPAGAISRVIGRGGCNINAIRENSAAHIDVDKHRGPVDRVITIKGVPESVRYAERLIKALVEDADTDLDKLIYRQRCELEQSNFKNTSPSFGISSSILPKNHNISSTPTVNGQLTNSSLSDNYYIQKGNRNFGYVSKTPDKLHVNYGNSSNNNYKNGFNTTENICDTRSAGYMQSNSGSSSLQDGRISPTLCSRYENQVYDDIDPQEITNELYNSIYNNGNSSHFAKSNKNIEHINSNVNTVGSIMSMPVKQNEENSNIDSLAYSHTNIPKSDYYNLEKSPRCYIDQQLKVPFTNEQTRQMAQNYSNRQSAPQYISNYESQFSNFNNDNVNEHRQNLNKNNLPEKHINTNLPSDKILYQNPYQNVDRSDRYQIYNRIDNAMQDLNNANPTLNSNDNALNRTPGAFSRPKSSDSFVDDSMYAFNYPNNPTYPDNMKIQRNVAPVVENHNKPDSLKMTDYKNIQHLAPGMQIPIDIQRNMTSQNNPIQHNDRTQNFQINDIHKNLQMQQSNYDPRNFNTQPNNKHVLQTNNLEIDGYDGDNFNYSNYQDVTNDLAADLNSRMSFYPKNNQFQMTKPINENSFTLSDQTSSAFMPVHDVGYDRRYDHLICHGINRNADNLYPVDYEKNDLINHTPIPPIGSERPNKPKRYSMNNALLDGQICDNDSIWSNNYTGTWDPYKPQPTTTARGIDYGKLVTENVCCLTEDKKSDQSSEIEAPLTCNPIFDKMFPNPTPELFKSTESYRILNKHNQPLWIWGDWNGFAKSKHILTPPYDNPNNVKVEDEPIPGEE